MLKLSIYSIGFIVVLVTTLNATSTKSKMELISNSVEASNDGLKTVDDTIIYYEDSIIKANSSDYNRSKKLLKLDGDIEIISANGTKEHARHMQIQTDTKETKFDELFMISSSDIWVYSTDAFKKENEYTFKNAIMSSCDVQNPMWQMEFSESIYDKVDQDLTLYGAKIFLGGIPVFYTPYLIVPLNKTRKSGLLTPTYGYSESEGFMFEQPIFWNISPSMDMEFNPQIRTNRSKGIYSTFRFVDSAYSNGSIRLGTFRDIEEQATSNELNHYGIQVSYDSSKFLTSYLPNDYKDGIYFRGVYLNDIEYLNLQKSSFENFGQTPLQESILNYSASNNDFYFGIYSRYFIDTREEDNSETMQIVPHIQVHKYLDSFLWDNLTYSLDLDVNNFTRESGITMTQAEFNIPVEFTTSMFNDYLNVSIAKDLHYSKYFFGQHTNTYDKFEYSNSSTNIKIFSDLTKDYGDFVHVIEPSINYVNPGSETHSPIPFSSLASEQQELFVVSLPEEEYDVSLKQYFYDDSMALNFYHTIAQKYYPQRDDKWTDIVNEMQYSWKRMSIYNNLTYVHEYNSIRESASRFNISGKDYNFAIGHTYKQKLPDVTSTIEANTMDMNVNYTYNEKTKLWAGVAYDIDKAQSTQYRFGGSYKRDCWNFSASVRQDIIPRPLGFETANTIFFQIELTPFGAIGLGTTVQ